MTTDEKFMARAIELAKQAEGKVSPGALVGCVLVKDGEIVGEGYHQQAGFPHAEVEAIRSCQSDLTGATVYVNLEPCCHFGRTPPCVDALIKHRVGKVVTASLDPNPKVHRKGIQKLRDEGIEVVVGVLEKEARYINRGFFCFHEKSRPFVSLKAALSLDGKIATRTGDSKWLSGNEARTWAHRLRNEVDAILVGRGTVETDDPSLTVRHIEGTDPKRYVLDSSLRSSFERCLFSKELATGTHLVYCQENLPQKSKFEELGVHLHRVAEGVDGRVCLSSLMEKLFSQQVQHILVEGGGIVHGAFLDAGLVDELFLVYTPWLLGNDGIPAFQFQGTDLLTDSFHFSSLKTQALGEDILVQALF